MSEADVTWKRDAAAQTPSGSEVWKAGQTSVRLSHHFHVSDTSLTRKVRRRRGLASTGPGRGYPVAVRRRWLGLIAVVVAAATGVTVAAVSRGESKPPKPAHANPAKQYGDDADLMRRLERNKLVKKTK